MRVDAYNAISKLYQSQTGTKTSKNSKVSKRDEVQISQIGKDYQVAKAAVADSSDIREDLVASIKSRIDNGTYQVSNSDFAKKVIAKYEEQIF